MNRWVETRGEYESCLEAINVFLQLGAKLPEQVAADDVQVVGFEDECRVRQTKEVFSCFTHFLSLIAESEFYFNWLEDDMSQSPGMPGVYPSFFCDQIPDGVTDFVRLQADGPEDVFSCERWLITSPTMLWAIYGEQYNSEMSLFLSRKQAITAAMRSAFSGMITDPREALMQLGDPSDTELGKEFEARFLRNFGDKGSVPG